MFEIYPKLAKVPYKCPACGCQLSDAKSLYFQGPFVLAEIDCTCCDEEYYQTFPIRISADWPISFLKNGQQAKYSSNTERPEGKQLSASMMTESGFEPQIELIKYKETSEAVIFHCLDVSKANVVERVKGVQNQLDSDPEMGVILLIPNNYKWLFPEGVAEIWSIHTSLQDFGKRLTNLDNFVKNQFERFKTVYLK